jgi:hypothetical protein
MKKIIIIICIALIFIYYNYKQDVKVDDDMEEFTDVVKKEFKKHKPIDIDSYNSYSGLESCGDKFFDINSSYSGLFNLYENEGTDNYTTFTDMEVSKVERTNIDTRSKEIRRKAIIDNELKELRKRKKQIEKKKHYPRKTYPPSVFIDKKQEYRLFGLAANEYYNQYYLIYEDDFRPETEGSFITNKLYSYLLIKKEKDELKVVFRLQPRDKLTYGENVNFSYGNGTQQINGLVVLPIS